MSCDRLLLIPLIEKKKLSWFMSQYAAFKDVSEHGVGNSVMTRPLQT